MSQLSRRAFLVVGALVTSGVADACSSPHRPDVGGDPRSSSSLQPPDAGGTVLATPVGQSASRLSRAQIEAEYAGAVPTSWGLQARGVVQSLGTAEPVVALTFDACGGPTPTSAGCGYDAALIDLLRQHRAKATLFLNARWIAANPATADELISDPLFEIGNHGTRHLPLSVTGRAAYGEPGTGSPAEAYDEVAGNHDNLTRLLGHPPRFFRSGTAFCDDVGVAIAAELGEKVVSFTVNGDAGTTFTAPQVEAALATAGPGDIVISHVNRPPHQTAEGYAAGLPKLLARGLRTVTLSEYLH